ncbi:YndM family protein [Brevibacillus ruminantium]|uniref:YndM family protein n=1 Tax=Brevibacillus ruminantium TaxID=2950604 RepID=A0ABY4WCM5_9BACL|nr:DUF2512 family protein [Brevibacillus ruminantium]USG64932.1 YndM family protein [Brevibacillus ruminantium]
MDGLLVKLIVTPLAVIVADALFPEVNYANLYQSIGVGLVIAVAGYLLELLLLRPGMLWLATAVDMIAGFLIVWLSGMLFSHASIAPIGAGFVAILLGVAEYLQHIWLLKSGRAEKI